MANRINFQIGYSIDKAGLSEMQSLFQQIANKAKEPGNELNTGLQKAAATANTLDGILEKTFNTNLGTLNVTKFNQELSKSGLTLKDVQSNLSQVGNQGATAYNRLAQAVLGTNLKLKESNKLLDNMATTMANTVKWGITSSIFNNITSSIQKAYSYSKQLDTSLNDIRIVTDKSADSMDRFAEQANEAAKGLGASTLDYTNAALIYYQQGLSDEEAAARAETTIKAANITGQTGEAVSEQLTAVWNGYKVTAEETELYVDKLAAVAATTAADLEELSVGMSKVASAANSMGVDFDDLNAQIATIVSVTRQAPESVGTALKTIYARLGDLKVDGVDEFGVKLGEVSAQMQQMGIQILDQNGDLRDMSSVIAEVAGKWDTWTSAQKQAAAVAMAGKRQYNNLIALFDNWDMYTDALNTSTEAMGTLQHQQDIYMESTAAKLKTLKATWQDLYGDLINQDELNAGIEGLTNLVQVFDNFIESFGGGIKSIGAFGAIVSNIFNKQIVDGINAAIQRQEVFKQNLELAQANAQIRANGVAQSGANVTPQDLAVQANTEIQLEYAQKIYDARIGLNQEQYNSLVNYQQEIGKLEEEKILLDNQIQQVEKIANFTQEEIQELEKLKYDEFEIQSIYGQRIDDATILVEKTRDVQQALDGELQTEAQIKAFKQNILEVSNQLDATEQKNLQNLLKQVSTEDDIVNFYFDIEQQLSNILNKNRENLSIEQKKAAAADKVSQSYQRQYQVQGNQNNIKQQADAMLELGNNAATVAQRITIVTSSLSSMAMAWSSVSSLIKTWSDDSISFGDKLTQSVMTLGMTIPMVISSFNKLKEIFDISKISLSSFTTVIEAHKLANEALIATSQAKMAQDQANIALEEVKRKTLIKNCAEELIARETNIAAMEQEAAVEEIKNTFKNKSIFLSNTEASAIYKEIIAREANTAAIEAETAAQEALDAAMLANPIGLVIAGIVALTAAIAGVVVAYNEFNKKQLENARTSLEEAKARQSEIDANKELYKSYKEALSSYEDGTGSREDLNDAIGKVCDAYDIEINKLDLLAGKYDKVTAAIKAKKDADLQESKDTLTSAKSDQEIVAFQEARKGVGRKTVFGDSYETNFLSRNPFSFADENLATALQDAVSDQFKTSGNNFSFQIDYGNMDQMLQFYDELQIAKKEYIGLTESEQRANSADFALLNEWLERVGPEVESYREIVEQLNNTKLEIAFNDEDFSDESSVLEIYHKLQEIKQNVTDVSTKDFNNFVENAFSGIEKLEDASIKINLAEDIQDKTGEEIDSIIEEIDNFNADELYYLQLHLNTAALSDDLATWVEEHADIISFNQTVATNDRLGNALENYDEKKGFKQEDIDAVYTQPNAEEVTGLTADEFSNLDYSDQLQALTNAWIENTKEIVVNKETIINSLKEEQKGIEDQINAYREQENQANRVFNNLISENEILINQQDELKEALKDLASDGYDELDSESKKLIDDFSDLEGSNKKLSKQLGDTFNKADNLAEAYEDYDSIIEQISQAENDHAANVKKLQKVMSAQSGVIDDIQSAYKSLNSIIDDYNSTGAWTIDNVQQLISMDSQYVATLQFENGQLVLNESAFQALTLAKLDDMEATLDAEYQEKMLDLAQQAVTESAKAASSAMSIATQQAYALGEVSADAAAKVQSLADALAAIDASGSASIKNEAEQETKAYNVKKQAINEARNSIKKGGSSFKKAMGGGGGGGKKGGGGGGGGGSKEEKEEKKYEDEFDRYWELTHAIDATDRALKRLEKDKENLYGYELIDALKQENELLDQQKANYEALLAAQQQEAAQLREQLSAEGVMFDASGAITNYAQATADALAKYNAAIAQYNAGLIDATTLGVYEKNYEAFKQALQKYEQLFYIDIQETQDKIDEIERKQLANNLKAWEVEVEIKLEKKQLERDWNDFIHDVTKDFQKVYGDLRVDLKNLLDDAKTYLGKDGTIGTIIEAVHDVTEEIDKLRDGEDSDMFESISQAQEKLKELNEQLLESGRDLHELWEEAWDIYLDGIDQVADKFDDLIDRFERINDELDFQREIIELLYGEEAYGLMSKLYEGQEHNLITQIDSLKQQKDMWEELWRQSGATMENQEEWNQDQRKYYEEWMEAQEDLNDLVIEYIQLLKDDYLNTVSSILKELEQSLTGSSLDKLKDEWEKISDHADKYYDSVEGAYHIQTLANKINQSIADTDNVKAQEKLQKLREKEISDLREKKNLTEYDLQAAEARYQVALKEIALEEAQNNKTSMKLTRNEEGNWSYQYVADEDDVATKRQELLDAYNQLYQLASDAYEANLESLQTLQEQYIESAREIYENENLSEEERQQYLLELREWYLEQYQLLAEENSLYRDDLATSSAALLLELYEQDQENYTAMTEAERELVDELINANIDDYMELEDALTENYNEIGEKAREVMSETRVDWTSGAQQIADLWNKDSGFSVKVQVVNAYTKIREANEKYKQQVDDCAKRVERDFGEEGIVGAIKKAEEETDNLKDVTADMVNSSEAYLNELRSYVDMIADAWRSVQDEIMGAISLIQEYLGYVGEYNSQQAAAGQVGAGGGKKESASGGSGGGGKGGSGGSEEDTVPHYDIRTGETIELVKGDWKKQVKDKIRQGYATGGYTGEWSSGDTDGRLAFLHQKELVLNKDDTSNFLSGISMLRDMSSLNGSVSDAITKAVANMVYNVGNPKAKDISSNAIATNNESSNNIFNINAEFPNANDVNEIREAILSLPNMASQYINK